MIRIPNANPQSSGSATITPASTKMSTTKPSNMGIVMSKSKCSENISSISNNRSQLEIFATNNINMPQQHPHIGYQQMPKLTPIPFPISSSITKPL